MKDGVDQVARTDTLRVFETGVRVALEEILTGRDYARVENILRALAEGCSIASPPKPNVVWNEAQASAE